MGVGPRNDDFVSFQRLAQAIQGLGAKFRQFVEEKHAIVRKRHLARPHPHAAPREGGHGGGMMGCAEGARAGQGAFGDQAGH